MKELDTNQLAQEFAQWEENPLKYHIEKLTEEKEKIEKFLMLDKILHEDGEDYNTKEIVESHKRRYLFLVQEIELLKSKE